MSDMTPINIKSRQRKAAAPDDPSESEPTCSTIEPEQDGEGEVPDSSERIEGTDMKEVSREDLDSSNHRLRTARAILDMYSDTIPDSRAEERYVIWTVLEKMTEVVDTLEEM